MKKVSREKYIDVAKLLAIICVMISHTNLLPNEINVFFNTFSIVIFFTPIYDIQNTGQYKINSKITSIYLK